MNSTAGSFLVWVVRSFSGRGLLVKFGLFILLVGLLAACSGGASETAAPAPDSVQEIATEPVEPAAAVAAESQEIEPQATAVEPAAAEATETLEPMEPTEVPQEASAAPAGASVQACDILTAAEAEAYLLEPVGPPETLLEGQGLYYVTSCSYTAGDNKISLIITENVDKDPRVPASAFESDLTKAVENFGVEAVAVPGLGDMASWASNPDWYVNNLDVVKGYYRIYLSTGGGQSDQPPPALVEIAQMVLSKLP